MATLHPTSRRPQSPARTSSSDKLPDAQQTQHRRGHHDGRDDWPSLPHGARPLSRWDYAACQPVFAHYLARQKKGLRLADLSASETRRRWRSFVCRWNRGGLPDGWYQPQMALRAVWAQAEQRQRRQQEESAAEEASRPTAGDEGQSLVHPDDDSDSDHDVDSGPDSDHDGDHDSDHDSRARDLLGRNERAEHDVRLQELLPRITGSRSSSSSSSTTAGTHYRRMLVVLQQRRQNEGGSEAMSEGGGLY